ncbi:Efflux transporter, RND family [Desulfonema limicola]|uniref:Efflux transporter, RND family n=1 Tax=Desulfonema limicola TaxID=45656 RepID=A0A975B8Q0_9BACT|nr:efflux RND transporter periplasmic adaptor subunit [Desulfonema limicola]QTA80813.1 Efflux transporter, RND family [Desulfonema limicola]
MYENKDSSESEKKQKTSSVLRIAAKIILPLLVLCAGIAGASYIKNSASKPGKRPPQLNIPLVEAQDVQVSSEQVIIQAMGTIIPAREIVLKSRIGGEIIAVHPEFKPGGYIMAEQEILTIDPKDYELLVTQKKGQVANALYALKMEMGQQDIASREWKLVNGNRPAKPSDKELILRKPHLEKAKADLEAAKADLEQARLNLSRTKVTVPFNAVIKSRNVETGSQISSGEQLADVIAVDQYWIQVSVPIDRLEWMKIPATSEETGSEVTILYRDMSYERTGHVIRLLSELENEGRMARIIVAVDDPLNLENPEKTTPPLLLGEYVRVEIKGRELDHVLKIPRTALRDNNSIWVAENETTLSVRPVKTLWRDKNNVLLKNVLNNGEKIIISDLSTPVDGMKIRIAGSKKSDPEKTKPKNSGKKNG